MREATGELNMTVIIVIAVAGLMAFFSMFVWPMLRTGLRNDENCSDAICDKDTDNDGIVTCRRKLEDGTMSQEFECPYKG